MRKDHLHLTCRKADSYNKAFNFIISAREPGKSTMAWTKVYKLWKYKGRASIVIRRQTVDITETWISDIAEVINKFQSKKHKIKLEFKKGDIKEGIVDIKLNGKLFIRCVALSIPKSRFKSTIVRNPGIIVFDEFICDNRHGEKYINDESGRFLELYNTYQRECKDYMLKCYFLGNPYSLYNPYFTWIGVDTLKLKQGAFIVGNEYIVECYRMKPELKEAILKRNPLYKFDNDYVKYAFNGEAINDANYIIKTKRPDNYYLKYVFRINNKYLALYKGSDDVKYWCTVENNISRKAIAVDFNNLCENTNLLNSYNRQILYTLKLSIATRSVAFSSIEAGYLLESIYTLI